MTPLRNTPATPRYELEATVLSHERIIRQEFEIVFHAPALAQAARPGQFVALLFGENYAPLIRRPFSIYRLDPDAGTFSVLYQARGSFTSGLAQKRVGDTVSVLGPLGNPFRWEEGMGQPLLIGGGIGIPPLYCLARAIAQTRPPSEIRVLNGARTEEMLVGVEEFTALGVTLATATEDGSHGRQGRVTDLLVELLDAPRPEPVSLFACGPMPMLRALADIALPRHLPCQISIETPMPCGIGACYGCALPVHSAESEQGFLYARACWDGPVFEAHDLVWEVSDLALSKLPPL